MQVVIKYTAMGGLVSGHIIGADSGSLDPEPGQVVYAHSTALRLTWVSKPVVTLNEGVYYEFKADVVNLSGDEKNVRA